MNDAYTRDVLSPSDLLGPTTYLIDGYNYLHAVLLRGRSREQFWSFERQRELCAHICALGLRPDNIVFDAHGAEGADPELATEGIIYAESADDEIVRRVRMRPEGLPPLTVITADRPLGDRARYHGARIIRPWDFEAGAR